MSSYACVELPTQIDKIAEHVEAFQHLYSRGKTPVSYVVSQDSRLTFRSTIVMLFHGATDLETGKTKMIEALTVNAMSTIALLMAIEIMYPLKRWIHVFLDNAKYLALLQKTKAAT